jgi:hypothetical protein
MLRQLTAPAAAISAVRPAFYAARFRQMMARVFLLSCDTD